MNLDIVNQRVDRALADNQRAGNLVIMMSFAIFSLGMLVIVISYWQKNPYITIGTTLTQGFLYWPIREILRLRKDNVILQTVPVLVSSFEPDDASKEIIKLLAYLRGRS
jgi:hypothetical protein